MTAQQCVTGQAAARKLQGREVLGAEQPAEAAGRRSPRYNNQSEQPACVRQQRASLLGRLGYWVQLCGRNRCALEPCCHCNNQ